MRKLIALLILIIGILIGLMIINEKKVLITETESNVLTNNYVTDVLFKEQNKTGVIVYLDNIKESEILYQNGANYYFKESNTKILNKVYPIYSADNKELINIDDKSSLIDEDFNTIENYFGTILVEGGLYNKDRTKVDQKTYTFLKTSNNLLINSIPLEITTENNTYIIPSNSIINFTNKSIKYYSIDKNLFKYNEISDVDINSTAKIKEKTYLYNDLLSKFGKKGIGEEIIKILNPIEEIIEETIEENIKEPNPISETKIEYIEPNITLENFKENIYSIDSNVAIYDPSGKITTPLTILVKKNNKIIQRRTFYTSGNIEIGSLAPNEEYEIEAKYVYLDETEREITKIIKQQKIKTKDLNELDPIRIEKENGKIFSSKIEIKNIRITTEINNQIKQGVKKATIIIDGDEYKLSKSDLSALLTSNSINYTSPEKIQSDKTINYEIKLFDTYGNEFKIENNKGTTRTCKKAPSVKIKTKSIDVISSNFSIELNNPDNINIANYKYIVYNQNLQIISEGEIEDDKIKITDLNHSDTYTLKVFADYDIGDGDGTKINQELGNTKFIVPSLSSLGYIRINTETQDITSDSAKILVSLDLEKTDYRLVFLMTSLEIKLTNKDNETYKYTIETEELERLKSGEQKELNIENLDSNTTYNIEYKGILKIGQKENIINTLCNITTIETLKKQPQVLIKNKFSSETMIDFDVTIEDIDTAILDNKVTLEVRDEGNKIIAIETIETNQEYQRFTYNKLESDKDYTFIFTAQEYNIGNTNVTYRDNLELKRLIYRTTFGINGQIKLNQLVTVPLSKNLYDFEKNTKSLSSTANYSLYKKNEQIKFEIIKKNATLITFAPDVDVEPNTTYIFSFNCEMTKQYGTTGLYVYDLSNGQSSISVTNMSTTERKIYKFKTGAKTQRIKLNMYIGGINTTNGNNVLTEGDIVTYKNIQLEQGNNATAYTPFKSNEKYKATVSVTLNDTNEEINNNRYYIDIYRNGEFEKRNNYSMDNMHQIIEQLQNIDVEKNSEYELKLSIEMEERIYEIAYLSFTTEKEIRSISTIDDFLNMSPEGKYIVTNDLDFRGINKTYETAFKGEIDFQGHKIFRNVKGASSYIIRSTSSSSVIKNLVLEITIDNTVERRDWFGFIYESYGIITNVMITLNSSINNPNVGQSLLAFRNRGIIDTFVVNTKEPIHGLRDLSLITIDNYGTIRNGYVYGEGIDTTYNNEQANYKSVGLIASNTASNSLIENIYSLANIKTYAEGTYNKQVGTLIGRSERTLVKNVYSVTEGKIINNTNDVSIGIISGNYISKDAYYVSDTIYTGSYSQKVSPLALSDIDFQNNTLNTYNKFKVEENITKGYYPHVIFNECMPRQELIKLKEVQDSDLVDIVSSEILEPDGENEKVKIIVNNPSLETITSINIKYLTTEILSQKNIDGKSEVILKITNPQKYLSNYSVMSINSQSTYGKIYVRNYNDNERNIGIELYRKIRNLNDWRLMNTYPSENFQLENDLDFMGAFNIVITKTFAGKLNGNNHIIKNINIEEQNGLINTLSGSIENLYAENYKKTSNTPYGGLVGQATGSPTIKNVHMTNVEINGKYAGGIIGYATYIMISDSSVTNFKVNISSNIYSVNIGSLIGYINNVGYIQNCFAQDVDIEVLDTLRTRAVGALVGNLAGGTIENVYTTGKINANATLGTGGIVGFSSGTIRNAYSYVDIKNKFEYVGGIAGYDDYTPSNTLVIGNIYSNSKDNYTRRTIGNKLASVTLNNYAYDKQLINGYETEVDFGEELLTYEQLTISSTYTVMVQLGDYFDYSEVESKHCLPKLYGTDGNLLPNQKNNTIKQETNKVEILAIDQKIADGIIYLSIDNPENYPVESIEFDYLKIKSVNLNQNNNGKTYINVTVEPDRYYDTYKLEKINFNVDGTIKTIDKSSRIEMLFYKNLGTFEDWQQIEDTNENYRLVADIDFENKVNINKNISFGRLEGTDEGHTLKNINISFKGNYQALIKNISKTLENVNFENINITNNSNGSYFGIIVNNSATINNVNFKNITITARNIDYVGSISNNTGKLLENISLENMNITGKNYIGSLMGTTTSQIITSTQNIKLKDITVLGTSRVGGAVGNQSERWAETNNINYDAYNINVTGTGNYVGGIFGGNSTIRNSKVEKVTVTGVTYVGGISGYTINYIRGVTARDFHIKGSGNTIGGLAGYSNHIYTSYLYDSDVTGTTTSSNNVGGIAGNSGWNYSINQSGTTNVTVKSQGSNIGGIRGYQGSSISYCFVYNGVVEGASNVGGAAGKFVQGTISNTSINAKVKATRESAGGLIGYVNNQYTTNANNVSKANNNMVLNTTVESPTNAGGLIGKTDKELYSGHYYNNLVVADISTTAQDSKISISVGSNSANASLINNFRTYAKSTLNGATVESITSNGLTSANILTLDQLKTRSSYTNMGLSTTYFDLIQLDRGYFPLIKTSNTSVLPNQTPIELPKETPRMMMMRSMKMMSRMTGKVHELPEIYVYQTDIDKINIELSTTDEYTQMNIYQNEKLIDTKDLTQRVYTYIYDFDSDLTVELTDGLSTKTKTYNKKDLNNEASVYNNNYYYIKQNKIKSNTGEIQNNFVNIYKNQALTEDGVIYDLENKTPIGKIDKNMYQQQTTPLYTFEYNGEKINTYKTYSEINNKITNYQLIVKNNKLYTLDANLPMTKNSIILDYYGNNSYQSILCKDGYIYDLNTKLNVPKKFQNSRITYMTNNIFDNSSYIIIKYEDGTVYGFDYRTGKEILNDKTYVDITITEYLYNSFVKPENIMSKDLTTQYDKAIDLKNELIINPIEKILNKQITETDYSKGTTKEIEIKTPENYTIVYDYVKNDYVVYNTDELINNINNTGNTNNYNIIETNNITPENTKIESDINLYNYYNNPEKGKKQKVLNRIIIFIIILILIILSLLNYTKNTKKVMIEKQS